MKILAIDGNSILNRAFYGIKVLSNKKGFFTNAITGFMNIYLKEIELLKPDCVVVAFDLKAPTFRHKKVESYKANRKGMPMELASQLPVMKDLLKLLGVTVLEVEGFEADDVLGTLAKFSTQSNDECYILTGDRDNLQLINDNVTIRLATNKETISYDEALFVENYGLKPIQLIDLKALMGDSSDNISGVAGIGEKTALTLIKAYPTVEELYENIENLTVSAGVKAKLEKGKEDAFTSKWLATISQDAPIESDISSYILKERQEDKLKDLLVDLEMFKLAERLKIKGESEQTSLIIEDNTPKAPIKLEELTIEKLALFTKETTFIYKNEQLEIFLADTIYYTKDESIILSYFASENKKRTINPKVAYKFCFKAGKNLENLTFSADLAGYLLNSMASDYTVENLCNAYQVSYRNDMAEWADMASLADLCDKLLNEIRATEMENLLFEVEQPLCEVLASMEYLGIKIDTKGVTDFGEKLTLDIKGIEGRIFELSGHEFNISSPKQLGVVLFEELGLPAKKKTKTGYSTNAEVLESLVSKHPIISLIIEYRTLTKLNSTYVEGLLKVTGEDGRIHSSFNQTETRTGRISSTEPNMQNIPVRKEIGRNMRKFFVAKEDYILLDADYSQIELRVLAHVCDDPNMKEAFIENKDIHTRTASQVFDIPEDFVLPEMRSAAKAVNFGIIYGIGAFSLAKDIGVTMAQANTYIKDYLENFKNVSEYMDKTVADGIKNGFVTTIFNRRRYIPELSSSNKMLQAFGKRAAMNAPIQGAAADIIKIAMVKVYKRLLAEKLDARLILQVHDELIVESSLADKDRASAILQEEMENAVKLSVPLTADVNCGESWYIAKG